ncbi:hypothetical protein [Marinifilum sp. D714]|uniref:hypothetical protein n=1 Tax=Marinifilum sp. D714 TaxID=2937523 RepID=UPI0027BF2670|nr:hypothetical protein [Marinifilum sp. D714]MDQ2178358.1 hypothetical protein [Marinifilum sp. D714]
MKTFKTILLMMLFASITLSSCSDDDMDLTGDLIITQYGEYYSGGTYEIYTEKAALTESSSSTEFYPKPLREGEIYLNQEISITDLNHGTYYIEFFKKDSYNGESMSFQISGGKTTRISISSFGIKLEE